MIIDLSGTAAAHRLPVAAAVQAVFCLNIERAVVDQQLRYHRRQALNPSLLVRRIEKQHIESGAGRAQRGGEFYSIRADNLQTPAGLKQTRVLFERSERFGRLLDHHHLCRPARCGFEAERAASGKEIKTAQAVQLLPKPVEHGFADTIRRWPQAFRIGETQDPPPPLTTNDAYCIQDKIAKR